MHKQSDNRSELSQTSVTALVQQYKDRIARNTDLLFVFIMLLQWIGAIVAAIIISPQTWDGTVSRIHVHVWASVFLGGAITLLPVGFAIVYPGKVFTRHVIAAGQMLMSALLIHITGGRVETHFHVFGSLAILAFYRDWRVLMTASIVVYIDHVLRGYYWPQSVYGVLDASPWRAVEHAWWVGFEVAFLIVAIRQSLREITQIAERQFKLQSINAQVEAEVKIRTAELRDINKQMETFCYSMSHDLKAPLRGIQAFSEILVEDHGKQLDSEGRDYVNRIRASASKMNNLVNDLLEYSRVSTAKLSVTPVNLEKVTDEALRLLAVEIEEKNARVNIQSDLGVVLGHEATLLQVMLNLLVNGFRYGKLGVAPVLEISSERRNGHVRISVQDNGIGIPAEYQTKIFQIFERVPNSSQYSGTGVGLAIVSKSIERLGGTLGVDSVPGKGSTFWFELPAVTPVQVNTVSEIPAVVSSDH